MSADKSPLGLQRWGIIELGSDTGAGWLPEFCLN